MPLFSLWSSPKPAVAKPADEPKPATTPDASAAPPSEEARQSTSSRTPSAKNDVKPAQDQQPEGGASQPAEPEATEVPAAQAPTEPPAPEAAPSVADKETLVPPTEVAAPAPAEVKTEITEPVPAQQPEAEPQNTEPVPAQQPEPEAESERAPSLTSVAPAPPPVESGDSSSATAVDADAALTSARPPLHNRRFSMKFWATPKAAPTHKLTLSSVHEHEKKAQAAAAAAQHVAKSSASDRKAREYALVVREMIIGPTGIALPRERAVAKTQLSKVKSQLIEPKSANRVIKQLRALPMAEAPVDPAAAHEHNVGTAAKGHGPIHAVCLPYTDGEVHERHFALKRGEADATALTTQLLMDVPSVATATLDAAAGMFANLHIVDLLAAPNLGIGAPGDAPGLLSGAVPTAETVIHGMTQITPQLMDLGYAMGKAVYVDHEGVYPPTDRISVLTYWWGLEVVLPPPTLGYLANVPSVSHSVINFLTAMSVANAGVREVLPFVRYISQYVDFEFNAIQKMNEGQGVVCAATWIMPAAMVPRPWDFQEPPPKPVPAPDDPTSAPTPAPGLPAEADDGTQTDVPAPVPTAPTPPALVSPPPRPASPIPRAGSPVAPPGIAFSPLPPLSIATAAV